MLRNLVNTLICIVLISVIDRGSTELITLQCADEKCENAVGRGTTVLKYLSPDQKFKIKIDSMNQDVNIFGVSKSYYYIQLKEEGPYGFVPKGSIRENMKPKISHEVNVTSERLIPDRKKNFISEYLSSPPKVEETGKSEEKEVPVLETPKPVESKEDIPAPVSSNETTVESKLDSQDESDEGIVEDGDDEGDESEEESDSEEIEASDETNTSTESPSLQIIPNKESPEMPKQGQLTENNEELPAEAPEAPAKPTELLQGIPPSAEDPQFYPNTEEQPDLTEKTLEKSQQPEEVPQNDKIETQKPLDSPVLADVPVNTEKDTVKVEPKPESSVKVEETTENVVEVTEKPLENVEKQTEKPLEESDDTISSVLDSLSNVTAPLQEEEKTVESLDPAKIEDKPLNTEQKTEEKTPEIKEVEMTTESSVQTEQINVESTTEIPTVEGKTTETPSETVTESPGAVELNDTAPIPQTSSESTTIMPEIPQEPIKSAENLNQNIPEQTTETTPQVLPEYPAIENQTEPSEPVPEFKAELPDIPLNIMEQFNDSPSPIMEPLKTPAVREDEEKKKKLIESDPLIKMLDRGVGSAVEVTKDSHKESEIEKPVEEKVEETQGFLDNLVTKFWKKDESHQHEEGSDHHHDSLFVEQKIEEIVDPDSGFCEKLTPNKCPTKVTIPTTKKAHLEGSDSLESKSVNEYVEIMLAEAVEMMDFIITLGLTGLTLLIFTLGYYCINKARKEGPLIAKMNELERQIMVTSKENTILKGDLMDTKQKLLSIEDSSFGSNDMVIALKQELEMMQREKLELQDQVASLEKELETAAEAGLELNKMVSELLNNQSGSDSIISSVEELQRQLNEQQETIFSMNEALAAKSRENSEMQIQISELSSKLAECEEAYKQEIEDARLERSTILLDLDNLKKESDLQVNNLIEERNSEISRLNRELTSYSNKYEEVKSKLSATESRYSGLEETLAELKRSSKPSDFKNIMDVAELKADLLAVTKEKSFLHDQYQSEAESRKLLEDRIKSINEELSSLKQEFSVAEKDKLEAQTRLEVLSNYFKDKETTLQKELSVKEAMWMKQQGETTSTVEKVRSLNEENQNLRSQNDSLRAEIEAQLQAHKAQLAKLETRSHEAWLNARQAERKLEESRMESANLRRRLTAIAENPASAGADLLRPTNSLDSDSLNMPSPIRVESPNGPPNPNLMGVLPPPPLFPPVPFMPGGQIPPFMPFIPPPPGELSHRAPPLGRLMSPPPKRYTPPSHRYSPNDRSGNGRYTPDSRYDYSNFEETDYSPPPSPSPPRRSRYSPHESDRSRKSKGGLSSGSLDSNPPSRRSGK